MIPHDRITIDGDTAWVVIDADSPFIGADGINAHILDRPCDTCDGKGWLPHPRWSDITCNDCEGTRRHTFTIEVACEACGDRHDIPIGNSSGGSTLRVHVVPSMVLEITPSLRTGPPPTSAIEMVPAGAFVLRLVTDHYTWHSWQYTPITFPPSAKPGMYAVQLEVHQ